jgi:ABC-2 type transport system permease protein
MLAILKREFRAYFQAPLGYVFVSAVFFFSGYYFFTYNLYVNTTNMSRLFDLLFPVVLFLVPVLTMRLMSEEKRSRTDQLLLTAPVSRLSIVLGKYFSAVAVFVVAISSTVMQAIVMSFFAAPDWPVVLGNFIGLLLLGMTLIAICMFLSALTESQVIAAVTGFVVSLFLILVDALASVVNNSFLQSFLRNLSFDNRYTPFTLGLVDIPSVIFFLSISILFVFLTVAFLDKENWR